MKPDKDIRGAVAYARKELAAIFAQVADIEKELSSQEFELVELLTRLEDLHAKAPPLDADRQEDLVRYEFNRAIRRGLTLFEHVPKVSPYVAQIERLIAYASSNIVAYQALGIHSANLISGNHVMVPQLRIFVAEVLRGACKVPPQRSPKVHPSRDGLIYALLVDIVDRFGVTPTRNKASPP